MTSQKLSLWNYGIGWHIQKEQDEKCPLDKTTLCYSIATNISKIVLSYSIHFLCRNYNSKSWSPKTTVTSWVWSWADQSPTRITRLWPAGATLSKSSRRAGDWEAKPSASQSIWRSSHGFWRLDKCEQFRFVPKHFATRLVHCFSECFVCFHCSWKLPAYPSPKPMLLGTLRSDDGDGGANVKK